jgi:hypothetical protein
VKHEFDLLLQGGEWLGSGGFARSDVAIAGGTIERIAAPDEIDPSRVRESFDCRGMLIAPTLVAFECDADGSDARLLAGGIGTAVIAGDVIAADAAAAGIVRRLMWRTLPRADRVANPPLEAPAVGFRVYGPASRRIDSLALPEFEASVARIAGFAPRILFVAAEFGPDGVSAELEATRRALELAERSGAPIHLANVRALGAFDAIEAAKRDGLRITAGISLSLLLADPPGSIGCDRAVEALVDGTVDVVTPAPSGGEARFLADLVAAGARVGVGIEKLVERAAARPAALLGLPLGGIERGALAELLVCERSSVGIGPLRYVVQGSTVTRSAR